MNFLLIESLIFANIIFHRGEIVSYQNYVISRMPEVWGEDAAVFNPSRWFKENGDSISYGPFSKFQIAHWKFKHPDTI